MLPFHTLLLLGSATVALAQPTLPEPVIAALESGDCDQLLEQHRRYRDTDQDAVRDALSRAVFALPDCSVVDAELVRVQPIRGVDFFDPAAVREVFAP